MILTFPKIHKRKARVCRQQTDPQIAALLFYLWRGGQIRSYPLDPTQYPDNEATARTLAVQLVKMKLTCDCEEISSRWQSKLETK